MAGKRGSRRHSTTSFSENVVVAGTSYEMLEVLAFCNWERAHATSFNNDNSANFFGEKKYNEEFRDVYFLTTRQKNFKRNLILVVVLFRESKGLLTSEDQRSLLFIISIIFTKRRKTINGPIIK